MKKNQKTTVFIDKDQQSFEVENDNKHSTVIINADGIKIDCQIILV